MALLQCHWFVQFRGNADILHSSTSFKLLKMLFSILMASVPLPWVNSRGINVQNKGKKEVKGTLVRQTSIPQIFLISTICCQVSCWNVQWIIYSSYLSFHHPVSTDSSLGILGAAAVPVAGANWSWLVDLLPGICALRDCCCKFLAASVFMTLLLDLPLTLSCLVMSCLVETGELSSLKWNLVGYCTKLPLFTSAACHFQCSMSSIT